jgi:hypothetical protein
MARYTVTEAADILGVSSGAVRNRLSRGTLQRVREGGTVYVLLPADMSRDAGRDTTDIPGGMPPSDAGALMSEMRDRIRFLEEEVQRKDAILLNMTEAMKALSAPERESPETVEEASEGSEPHPSTEESQEAVQRPWWRRWFGG